MSNIFYGWTQMEVGTLSWLGGKWCLITKQLCFIGIEDAKSPVSCFLFCIWLCFVVLQIIMFNIVFQWSNLSELVLVMDRNPLLGRQFLWWVWVTILGDDWYCCFKGVGVDVKDELCETRWGGWKASILGGRS